MKKMLFALLTVPALLCGCGPSEQEQAAARRAEEERAASEAAARKAAGPSKEEAARAGAVLAGMLCVSPVFMEQVESSLDLFEALSGEGAEKEEVKRHFLSARARYRAVMEKELAARGSSYEALERYASGVTPWAPAPDRMKLFRDTVRENCPRGDRALVERTAGGLLLYCAGPAPQ